MKEQTANEVKDVILEEGRNICPNCKESNLKIFYEIKNVPAHSVLIFKTKEEAINYPKGNISLGFCENCGFVGNVDFDINLREYSDRYEETQGFSKTFQQFHKTLANKLINKYDLRNKKILEIGCGKGEFISLICELGDNEGYGFDPAYIPERNNSPAKNKIEFIQDYYSEKYNNYKADFFICKMTLEHIPDPLNFLQNIREAIGEQQNSHVFFQVPNFEKILNDCAFWDIYYEHCSYFTFRSISELFRRAKFEVIELDLDYDDQYLMIVAKPVEGISQIKHNYENDIEDLKKMIKRFVTNVNLTLKLWKDFIKRTISENKKIVLWGGGSKAVSFLTTLNITEEIQYAVDINPFKKNTYIAGTGQQIVNPEFLKLYNPDQVVVMNPIYIPEIKNELANMNLYPEIIPIDCLNANKYKE